MRAVAIPPAFVGEHLPLRVQQLLVEVVHDRRSMAGLERVADRFGPPHWLAETPAEPEGARDAHGARRIEHVGVAHDALLGAHRRRIDDVTGTAIALGGMDALACMVDGPSTLCGGRNRRRAYVRLATAGLKRQWRNRDDSRFADATNLRQNRQQRPPSGGSQREARCARSYWICTDKWRTMKL